MTDDEIIDTLKIIRTDMRVLLDNQGINYQTRTGERAQDLRERIREAFKNKEQRNSNDQDDISEPTDEV